MTIAVSHESRPRKKPNTVIQWPCNPLTLCHFVFQTSLLEKGEEKKQPSYGKLQVRITLKNGRRNPSTGQQEESSL